MAEKVLRMRVFIFAWTDLTLRAAGATTLSASEGNILGLA
jgi:hypothetical protein